MSRKAKGDVWVIMAVGALLVWLWKELGWLLPALGLLIAVLTVLAVRYDNRQKKLAAAQQKQHKRDMARQHQLDVALEAKQREAIRRHELQGLTPKEEMLLRLSCYLRISLPLAHSIQQQVKDADQVFLGMVDEGYFQAADPVTIVDKTTTGEQLKNIFREHELPVGGRKAELLERLFTHLPATAEELARKNRFYVPTDKVRQLGEYLEEKKRIHAREHAVLLAGEQYLRELRILKDMPEAYGLAFQPAPTSCRHCQQWAGLRPRNQLPATWPPPECEHTHACNCQVEVVFDEEVFDEGDYLR